MIMPKIGVIGAGSWGTTLAILLAEKGYKVTLWVFEGELVWEIDRLRENTVFLPGVTIPKQVKVTNFLEEAVTGQEVIISAVPSHTVREITQQYRNFLTKGVHIVSATKGLEIGSLQRMSQVIKDMVTIDRQPTISCLSGPSFAREVSSRLATAVTLACTDQQQAGYLQQLFSRPYFRVYRNDDLIGVELAGSLKNIFAIAAGISDGLGLGANARAGLITRGLAEMIRLGTAMGAKSSTFYGLAGMGDLILTCTGDLSRNRSLGLRLGKGEKLSSIIVGLKTVAEGILTIKSAIQLAGRVQVEMPITEQLSAILFEGKDPQQAFTELMGRSLKDENCSVSIEGQLF